MQYNIFSATLLPVNYYKEMLSGEIDDYAVYAHSPFKAEKKCIVASKDVSSRYTRRNDNEYEKICRYIYETVNAKKVIIWYFSHHMDIWKM